MTEKPGAPLERLVERLDGIVERDGQWRIATDDLIVILGMQTATFWQKVQPLRGRIDFLEAVDGFCQDSVGDLVTVLEGLGLEGVEEALTRAGVFLPYPIRAELLEELLFAARRRAAAHEIQEEELAAMLRFTRDVSAAVTLYLQEHVDLSTLLEECAESFCIIRGMRPLGARTVRWYLSSLFTRHIVEKRTLLAGLEARLRLAAALMGYSSAEEQSESESSRGAGGNGRPARTDWALRVMGIPGGRISKTELRSRYRQLIMQYHPDVNPAGLERCKDITAAYSLLISQEEPA